MKIIHINQRHKLGFGINPNKSCIEETIQSQFKVAQEIKKHPGYPVLDEGLYEDASDADACLLSLYAKYIFPNGFPKNIEELTPSQKDFIYEEGAVFTLFYLGEIPAMYKSIHKEVSDDVDRKVSIHSCKDMDAIREAELIKCAKEAAVKCFGSLYNAIVIAVFGAAHNFKLLCNQEGFEYELINTQPTRKHFFGKKILNNHKVVDLFFSVNRNKKIYTYLISKDEYRNNSILKQHLKKKK